MSAYRVLVVDDEPATREAIREVVQSLGHAADGAASAEQARELLATPSRYDLVITDLMLPGQNGLELIARMRARVNPPSVVLVTGHASLETAIQALKAGASDYLIKPLEPHALKDLVQSLLSRRPPVTLSASPGELDGLVAQSRAMKLAIEQLLPLSAGEEPVLLLGESGVGKEQLAAWLHQRSPRRDGPFTTLHAASLPADLIETELFSAAARAGRLELALGGTLFIDDLDALDARSQRRLLVVLETGRFTGADGSDRDADVRLVAATSRDLGSLVAAGHFLSALQLRLLPGLARIPPLRERREDIGPLARRFTALFAEQYRKSTMTLSEASVRVLERLDWPGNVRELRNAIERAVILCQTTELDPDLLPQAPTPAAPAESRGPPELHFPVGTAIKAVEREMIVRTLDANRGNKNRTAKQLGISRRSLYNKLERYRIQTNALGLPEPWESPGRPGPANVLRDAPTPPPTPTPTPAHAGSPPVPEVFRLAESSGRTK